MDTEKNFQRLEELQKEYEEVSKELEKLRKWMKKIKKLNSKINEIEKYYYSDWVDDVEEAQEKNPNFRLEVMGEDAVYDMLSEHYSWCKKMIYLLSKQIVDKE